MSKHRLEGGFTLLELLVVVGIMAAVAGGALFIMDLGDERTSIFSNIPRTTAQTEMLQIKQAILRFKQETGFFPKEGPFRLTTQGGAIPLDRLPSYLVPGKREAWFDSPANFWLLYGRDTEGPTDPCVGEPNPNSPLCGTGHMLEAWNPDTARGWREPYLTRGGEGLVDIGDGLQPDGAGDPVNPLFSVQELPAVRGVADSFPALPVAVVLSGNPVMLFEWRTSPGTLPHPKWGRPYLLFDLGGLDGRIVGMGRDGAYQTCDLDTDGDCDELVDLCAPPPGSDDLVLCLQK